MRRIVAAVLLVALAGAPAEATWDNQGRLFVSWRQDVSGERCIAKESPGGEVYDYGCYWFFGLLGFPVGMSLPLPGSTPDAHPLPGDVIIVNGERVTVPLHVVYLPALQR